MNRAKEDGFYLYCSDCGDKLYQTSIDSYYHCGECGYVDNKMTLFNLKNVRKMEVA